MILYLLVAFMMSIGSQAAEKSPERTSMITVTTAHGDLTSRFEIHRQKDDYWIRFANSGGSNRSRKITKVDFDFLLKEINNLPMISRLPSECVRSRMTVTVQHGKRKPVSKSSCFGVPTETSAAYEKLANFLVMGL